jgi:glycosyltransferase involved in cell wall biosynthesis/GT2 family glycosyltransferase
MTSAGQSAHDTLKLSGQTPIVWAVFDPVWYLATYPDARGELDGADAAVLQFYLSRGQQRGHSPNIWFDEAWHLQRYPGTAAAVRDGHAASAFDSYCRAGFRSRSPHWLFNESLYRQRHPDLGDEVLARDGNVNGYDHYLKHRAREGRIGHLLFEPQVYHSQLATDERTEADAAGCYQHYLARIARRLPENRTSYCFDPIWYLRRYSAVTDSKWQCALHHYLTNQAPAEFDPLPEFSEPYYLQHNTDVAAAVEAKDRRNGYDHFLHAGAMELRSPCAAIDLRHYVAANPSVRSEIEAGRARDAFVHYLAVGREQGLPTLRLPEDQVTERQAAALYCRRAEELLPLASRTTVDFRCNGPPIISVIIVVRDAFPITLWMLASLRAGFSGDIELIVIDIGSTDDIQRIGRFVPGAQVLRFDSQPNVVRAANAALSSAGADAVLFIDGTLELAPGALNAALRRLQSDPGIGAVGGKVLRAHGRLESAGGIVWRDAATSGYLRDASPLAPDANFVREVDSLSGVLLLRGEVLNRIEGFDDALPIEGGAVADLCLRITEAGFRVVYDPAVAATRLTPHGVDANGADFAQEALFRKHANRLQLRDAADGRAEVFARASSSDRRVLFVEDTIPLRRLGSGFVRSNDLIHVMASLGYQVTVYPINPCSFGLATIYADMPDTVEVMHDRSFSELADFLAARQGYYDVIWIARTHNLNRIAPMLERVTPGIGKPSHIVLDTEAIATLREAEHAALTDLVAFDVDAAILREFVSAHLCQRIVAVNAQEAQRLREAGFSDVVVIGHWREVLPTPRAFADRAGMLFLAAIHEQNSPNRDALDWFASRVLPLVEQALGWETRLTIAGYVDPAISFDGYRDHPRITFRGPVEDIEPLYDAHRIVVAPTRYAAGLPYKVHEAASYGVPVVATELLRRQLDWQDGRDLLAADSGDPAKFAQQIIALYRDPVLWQLLRGNALDRIREDHGRARYEIAVRQAMDL